MQALLVEELQVVAKNRDLRALVLAGAGRAFSAGGDRAILQQMAEVVQHIAQLCVGRMAALGLEP